jgi:glycogen synthase
VRILVVTNLYPPDFLGGYELGCAQMVDALKAAGHDVQVVTTRGRAEQKTVTDGVHRVMELSPVYDQARMRASSPELQRYFHLRSTTVHPANTAELDRLITDFDPDVAYLWNLIGVGGLGLLALLRHRAIPWVWHLMDSIPRQLSGFLTSKGGIARQLSRVFPGTYIACSRHVIGETRLGEVDRGEGVHIVPNWVSGEPRPERTSFFDGTHLRLMSASGMVCEPKGSHILIEAAACLRERGHGDFVIDLFGGEDDFRFRALAEERQVGDVVHFMGRREHGVLLDLNRDYDVFAFPTWAREPFAFAPLEAAAAGCVPLISRDCGNAEWMVDGVDCLKAERSPEAFADRIAQIIGGKIDLEQLGRRAQRIVWRDFHISDATDKVQTILTEAAAQPRRAADRRSDFVSLARFAEGLLQVLVAESTGL